MAKDRTAELIIKHEGLQLKPYKDTIGKVTIGVGRNLTDNGITEAEAAYLLNNDINSARQSAAKLFNKFEELNEVRQAVLIDLAFNMGYTKLSQFKRFIAAIEKEDFVTASQELKNSAWYNQVGSRGVENCNLILRGTWM